MGDIKVQAINRRALSAALLAGARRRKASWYRAEARRLRKTAEGRDLLEMSMHPEDLDLVMA